MIASDSEPPQTATLRALRWLQHRWLAFLFSSAALLFPCFWHRHIQSGDLGSHLYNAWLSQLVRLGLLPGLHIAPQYTNVLIDGMLSRLLPYVGVVATQRIVVGFCVLVFFWGAFAFASSAAEHEAWHVAPLLAMISYGAIFHWGFFNFYLSAGFSLWGLAVIVRGRRSDILWLPLLFVVAAAAHPMGAACMIALGIYLAALRIVSPDRQLLVTTATFLVALATYIFCTHHFEVLPREIPYYWLVGADQLIVFGHRYLYLAAIALILCTLAFIRAARRQPRQILYSPWLQFYLVVALVVATAPGGLYSEQAFGMMGYLPDRGSLYSAVALATLVTVCRPWRWFVLATCALCIPYFLFLHHDTGVLEQRQQKVEALVRLLSEPRVISMLPGVSGWRIHEDHSVDRACISRCYSYNNYEPSTNQFRLQAEPDNRVVMVDNDALDSIKDGEYVVQPRDLPLYEVYVCGTGVNDLCIAQLHAGQQNGEVPHLSAKP